MLELFYNSRQKRSLRRVTIDSDRARAIHGRKCTWAIGVTFSSGRFRPAATRKPLEVAELLIVGSACVRP